MMEHRGLEIAGDEWLAEMRGEGPSRRLEIRVDGRAVGPLVTWPDDQPVLATGDVTHQEELREGVSVRWRLKGDGVTVAIYYEGRGRAAVRAAVGGIGEWEATTAFSIGRRSGWSS
jgi:hypothetical protein